MIPTATRLIGYVQLQVGEKIFAVPVQSMPLDQDGLGNTPGGFFIEGDELGIVVNGSASEQDVQRQIVAACDDAVRHIAKKFLN